MQIRYAVPFDARALARVYVRTFQQTYRGLVPEYYLNAMTIGQAERDYLRHFSYGKGACYVAEADLGLVVGFVTGGRSRNVDDIYSGEIYELYLVREYQRRGIGRQLVASLGRHFSELGLHTMMVWVLAQNPCRRFYEKINGIYLRSATIPFAGVQLSAVAYGWLSTELVQ
jgi:ribosomal protein S18 acetylase RimI-like enzyme